MFRYVLCCAIMCSIHTIGHSQAFNFGPRIGLHTVDIDAREIILSRGDVDYEAVFNEARLGANFGIATRFNIGNFFIQPEGLIKSQRLDYTWRDLSNPDEVLRLQFQYYDLEFPLHVGLRIGPVRLGAGIVANTMLNSWSDLAQGKGELGEFRYGSQYGIGFDIGRLILDFRYEHNLSGLGDEFTIDGATFRFDSRPERIVFSAGWFLIKPE